MKYITLLFLTCLGTLIAPASTLDQLMPTPRQVEAVDGAYRLDPGFTVGFEGPESERLQRYATRFLRRLDKRTGLFFSQGHLGPEDAIKEDTALRIVINRVGKVRLNEDESYALSIGEGSVLLEAETDIGALRGLETLLQLLDADADGYFFPGATIADHPRFPWRGLMIDSCRHFMPLDMIKRNLDGMAAVKLNVLHWHLSEDQGFRVECKTWPRLHEMGSDGDYYTHEQRKEIIAYANDRGIRVMPEFDMPGHATSWLVGYPELGSAPGPYEIERDFGIFKPTMDPTRNSTYEFLDKFYQEMCALFPDEYMHIGGDENTGEHWDANPDIQAFMRKNDIPDNHALQSYFNQRLLEILTRYGKKMIGWDEILQPDMPKNIVIHSWRGRESMVSAAKQGYRSILSNGYYIDLMQPASFHYLNDPLPEDIGLTEEEKARVLGGEATMWAELVSPETVDSRIWPRTAAIAERLWSSGSVRDVDDMYDRMNRINRLLEEHGLTHIKNRDMLMRNLAGGYDYRALEVLANVVEPLERYQRNADAKYDQFSPLTMLPDIALADAPDVRPFEQAVDLYLKSDDGMARRMVTILMRIWSGNHDAFLDLARRSPALQEALLLSASLQEVSNLGLMALDGELNPEETARYAEILNAARQPVARVELKVVDAIERLVEQALGTELN